eukprot:SAG11_NODE_47_length_20431_cov_7.472752_16_plen_59_part_00
MAHTQTAYMRRNKAYAQQLLLAAAGSCVLLLLLIDRIRPYALYHSKTKEKEKKEQNMT